MALRNVLTEEDPLLRKKSREVKEINEKILTLLDDMWETMIEYDGVGIAAPQVGVLRRIAVIDFRQPSESADEGDALDDDKHVKLELINPEIIESEGETIGLEGCLSVPGYTGEVRRPKRVKVKALDRDGNEIEVEGEDFMAKALCHEIDHLNGILYTDIADDVREL